MESIIARALEYTLKYWLKSFSRDQFKLQGRTAQLSNLDINGDALHASLVLPPSLAVETARVGKLQITLPSVSNVQVEPIVVNIDKLDLVLVEKDNSEDLSSTSSALSPSPAKNSGYGYADKIADGMTVQVGIVNLLLETHGGPRHQGGATWSPPLAAITFRDLVLYTTNEKWQAVNLKEARDFSNNKGFIYIFKKLEWQSLSVDLLPHPDMFTDARFNSSSSEDGKRDDDGAKRMFFGGERFLEGISGEANITVKRTEQNNPVGLEVQLHITEALCPALSEPGLRAFLRFMTGVSVCLNRGDVDPKAQQLAEAAGSSLVSIIVDHIFLCIKDAEFQLEFLMQSLFFSRASVPDGGISRNLSCIKIAGLFLRDTFSRPPCTLIQPSMQSVPQEPPPVPDFGQNFCPQIHPFENQQLEFTSGIPLFSLYCLQLTPSPLPPKFASKTVITCEPLMVTLQEQSCLRIASFLADGVVANRSAILPDSSINSMSFYIKEFDLSIPLDAEEITRYSGTKNVCPQSSFMGARLHVENLYFCESPSEKCLLLNLDKDPACFLLWGYQPVDASQRKWATRASHLSLSLETSSTSNEQRTVRGSSPSLWKCVELDDIRFEAAMVTADGSPLLIVPPPEGVVRIGVAFQQFTTNTSVEQLFFVLGLYTYFGQVGERISKVSKGNCSATKTSADKRERKLPSDTAVSLTMNSLQLNFLESLSSNDLQLPLVQFGGEDLYLKVSHRTLGGAFAVTTNLTWKTVSVNCLEGESAIFGENGTAVTGEPNILLHENGHPNMRAVFWVDHRNKNQSKEARFIDIDITHVMPYDMRDMECHSLSVSAKVSGVRLGGGMSYTESLLHRFGILGPDGGPGEGLLRTLKDLSSGPLAKLFSPSHLTDKEDGMPNSKDNDYNSKFDLEVPDDLDVSIELRNWLFALEGTEEVGDWLSPHGSDHISREEKCWHTTFTNLHVSGRSSDRPGSAEKVIHKRALPIERFTAGIEGLQAIKPCLRDQLIGNATSNNLQTGSVFDNTSSIGDQGVDVEATMVICEDEIEGPKWTMDNVKFSVKEPIEAVATKEELEHLTMLCRSEADAMGRITAGILRLLKLDKSLGQGTIEQLRNLGSGGIDNTFSPRKLSRQNSFGSIGTPRTPNLHSTTDAGTKELLESTVASLQIEILESKAKCTALVSQASGVEDQKCAEDIRQLNDKLESMQSLVTKLRTLI
ncbi:uncharacterized protein [Oryza sativa Japonica Group]|uniref:Os04g0628600 protein n=2 Tax=Oryza sativa subsp. japonica TaxID=39947 RepID=Q0J9W2_ORYSJ|nr:uncharacterized protein LOC4337084 isoform X1 [Oryza sativa Japonica Group]KAB8097064.1 hypothetical protein EE612_025715 [Oryza sativa]BAF15875.1 Os04g0628600 [Oryza sativa Japonica Group]BAS91143.1 Os04g0628600 [Oryza sativa Japonica Group]|eukprot:NP_001053961.1 Os04g0628600 [Oryza sativa Japonica Group]